MKTFKRYRSYSFVGQDPIVQTMRRVVGNHAKSEVERESGVSASTLSSWFNKKTKRPQFATIAAVTRAMGCDIKIVRRKGKEK